jgi:hypothetical protein
MTCLDESRDRSQYSCKETRGNPSMRHKSKYLAGTQSIIGIIALMSSFVGIQGCSSRGKNEQPISSVLQQREMTKIQASSISSTEKQAIMVQMRSVSTIDTAVAPPIGAAPAAPNLAYRSTLPSGVNGGSGGQYSAPREMAGGQYKKF